MLRCWIAALALAVSGMAAEAAGRPCPPDAAGTARVLDVETTGGVRVGTRQYRDTLPLGPKEVVLTFDDGPWPGTTEAILEALARECVRATFFVVGRNVEARPGLLRRIRDEGHTIANHTWSHPILTTIPHDRAIAEIERGQAAIDRALGAPSGAGRFFRFPGFAATPALESELATRGVAVFGADLWASDWNPMSADQQLALVTARLDQAGRGIVLFHDTKRQTAEMIPAFLRHLRTNGWRIVHIRPR